jgi:hypothetical protein
LPSASDLPLPVMPPSKTRRGRLSPPRSGTLKKSSMPVPILVWTSARVAVGSGNGGSTRLKPGARRPGVPPCNARIALAMLSICAS